MRLLVDPDSLDSGAAAVLQVTADADLAPAIRLLGEVWVAVPGSGLGLVVDSLAERLGQASRALTSASGELAQAYRGSALAYRAADSFARPGR